jgi:two-component system sensor histidine kinase YesM
MGRLQQLTQEYRDILHFSVFFNRLAIRAKLILFATVLITITSLANIYFYYQAYVAMDEYNNMLKDYSSINNLSIQLIRGRDALSRYLISKEHDEWQTFQQSRTQTLGLIRRIELASDSRDTYLLCRAIQNGLTSYNGEISKMFTTPVASRLYYSRFAKAKSISGYLESYIKQLLDAKLTEGEWYQRRLADRVRLVRRINVLSIIVLAGCSLFFVLLLSRSITGPLRKLTKFSTSIAQGDFNLEPLPVDSSADINILAVAFNKMVRNIQEMIHELTAKSDLERQLHAEEYKNLQIAQQLNEARFLALQSQINPHFLFNTLNTVMRTAMFEHAEKTSALIESLADLFRYNLDNYHGEVCIQEELQIIQQYIAIQQVRFRNRLGFELDCPAELTQVAIPRLTIQPLVENAIIHGIEPQESGGKVRIKIYVRSEQVIIKVIDNGMGMSRQKVNALLTGNDEGSANQDQGRRHYHGIGLSNVRERLLLFSKDPYCLQIQSKAGWGTVIAVRLPLAMRGRNNDQTINC